MIEKITSFSSALFYLLFSRLYRFNLPQFFIIFSCLFSSSQIMAAKPVEIIMWHSLAGNLGAEVAKLSNKFNHSQDEFIVRPLYKGDYNESLTSYAAAFRAGQAPALVQVFEVGASAMLAPKGIIKSLDSVMAMQGIILPKQSFLPAALEYYSENNQLMAMPFNISIPVMFYNADALAKIGYSRDNFPKTWDEFETLASKLKKSGFKCAYTTANPAWIFIESFSALHGLPVIDERQSKAKYNNEDVIKYLERLQKWQKNHYFEYGGRNDDSSILFTSGRCPIYSQSSGSYNSLTGLVPFQVGMAGMPLDTNITKRRYNNVVGGAALWITSGQSDNVYQGVAQFISFLAQPDIQLEWHQSTG
jgi:sn-glycerol 3-phosphate transport system substrate-binding protein